MLEELVESVVPGAGYAAIGLALGAAFGRQLRPVAKQAVKWGLAAGAIIQETAAEAYERGQDLVAEARHEHEQERRGAATEQAAVEEGASEAPGQAGARRAPRRGAPVGEE